MAVTKVVMPKLSEAMETGKLLRWLKQEGDRVAGGDIIAEVETDKADIELEAFGSGVLRKGLVGPGASGAAPRAPRGAAAAGRPAADPRPAGGRVRGRAAHPDPGRHRQADGAVQGAAPPLLLQ